MKYKKIIMLLLSTSTIILSKIEFINNSSSNIFISDHLSHGVIIPQNGSYIIDTYPHEQTSLFIYSEPAGTARAAGVTSKFSLQYRITETTYHSENAIISYSDLLSGALHRKYPQRFSVTTKVRLQAELQKQHQPKPIEPIHAKQNDVLHSGDVAPAMLDAILSKFNQLQANRDPVPSLTPPRFDQHVRPATDRLSRNSERNHDNKQMKR